jgi:lambda family phage tail tape measure protein
MAPSLNIPIRADLTKFKSDMQNASTVAGTAVRSITKQVISMNREFLASRAVGTATLAFGRLLGVLGPIALGITAVRGAFQLMSYSTEMAKQRIDEFNQLADKANASGFSTEFFQRITKSSAEARIKIDDITEALKRFNDASAPKLGGSGLQSRIDTLTKAGNFSGNSGVGAFGIASNSEGRLRAIVSLIDQAMEKGERLAAIDLASNAFGPAVADALRSDAGYLDDMLKRADAISQAKLVSDEDVARAIDLKERMEAAQKILAERWKPVQDDLAKLGMNYEESWVNLTEDLAAAVGYATQFYNALKGVPGLFADAGNWSGFKALNDFFERHGLNSSLESIGAVPMDAPDMERAKQALTAQLRNHMNVTRGMREATDVAFGVRGDTSKAPGDDQKAEANAFDRASESIAKHTARMEADQASVGQGAAAQERLRAEAQLLAAAQEAGIPITAEMAEKINKLAQNAGSAADALAKARVASNIEFAGKTALLSQEDVSIAQRLKTIYGNDVPAALASSEAAAMRFNDALRSVSTSIEGDLTNGLTDIVTGTKGVKAGFADMASAIITDIERMIIKMMIVRPLMQGLQSMFGFSSGGTFAGPVGQTAVVGPTPSAHGNVFGFAKGGTFTNAIVNRATPFRFASGGQFQPGVMGEAGPEAVMPLVRGPDGNLGVRGGSSAPQFVFNVHAPAGTKTEQSPFKPDGQGGGSMDIFIRDAVQGVMARDAQTNGPISKTMMAKIQGFGGR